MSKRDFSVLLPRKPLRSLLAVKTRGSGRNNQRPYYNPPQGWW
ncbi:MAG: hypothetical protein WDN66_04410 [Candidatus Saccharibacteria bacterium]